MFLGRKKREMEDRILSLERQLTNEFESSRATYSNLSDIIEKLEKDNKNLIKEIKRLQSEGSGTACIAALLGRGIEWFDVTKLDYQAQVSYWNSAKAAMASEALLNEAKHLEADLIKEGIIGSKDYQHLYGLRMSINGIQTLLERLESIPDPRKKESEEDLHAAI